MDPLLHHGFVRRRNLVDAVLAVAFERLETVRARLRARLDVGGHHAVPRLRAVDLRGLVLLDGEGGVALADPLLTLEHAGHVVVSGRHGSDAPHPAHRCQLLGPEADEPEAHQHHEGREGALEHAPLVGFPPARSSLVVRDEGPADRPARRTEDAGDRQDADRVERPPARRTEAEPEGGKEGEENAENHCWDHCLNPFLPSTRAVVGAVNPVSVYILAHYGLNVKH